MALGFILEKKKGPKLGLYWPSLKPDAVSFSTLVIGAAYTTDEFSMNLDYLQADAASGMSSRVAFGAGMTTLSSLHASFSWIFPLQSSNSQNFLSAMQISTFIKLFLGSSFFIHVQLSNNGLLLGGLGLSF